MTDTDRLAPLRRRLLSLGLGEIVAAAVFAVIPTRLAFVTADRAEAALWAALCPLLFILVQAGTYWLLARHHLPEPIPHTVARIYRWLRIINRLVLLASLIGIVVAWPGVSFSAVLIVVIWLFAVAEYINYFHVRLSYPWSKWVGLVGRWSTPRLVRDLHRTV